MKQFLPFLTDDQGRSLDVENEVVVTRSLPDPLDNSPEGWESNTIQFARNNEFRGIIKSYTTSLKFYLQGAKILRDAFYRKGMETVLFFIWLKLNQSFGGGLKHEDWYKGQPDFGTFKDEYDGVSINITEGGFYKDLQANKAVVQTIEFDAAAVSLYMDGLLLHNTAHYAQFELQEGNSAVVGFKNLATMPVFLTTQDGAAYGIEFISVNSEQISDSGLDDDAFMTASNNWAAMNVSDLTIDLPFVGHIDVKGISAIDDPLMNLYFKSSISGTTYQIIFDEPVIVGTTGVYDFAFTATLLPGEKLFSFRTIQGGGLLMQAVIEYQETSAFTISAATRKPATIIKCFRTVTLGSKISGKVSPGASLTSPLLDDDYNLLVTSGDAIRGLEEANVKSNFSDWHKSVDAVKCIAMDVVGNNPVVFDRYDKYDRTSVISDLGTCSNWTLEPAQDYIYDTVLVGYLAKPSESNIDLNGKYSFNNTFNWKINTTRSTAVPYDAVSKYFADPYDIELIRLNLGGKDTTAGATDNTNFFIDAELKTDISFSGTIHLYTNSRIELNGDITAILPFIAAGVKVLVNGDPYTVVSVYDVSGTTDIVFDVVEFIPTAVDLSGDVTLVDMYQLRRDTAIVAGLPNDGTEFNLRITPGRNLQRHYRWLRSSFDHLDSNKLEFKSTEKNKDLVTTLSGNTLVEAADIPVATMGEKVYLPYYCSFDIRSPENLLYLMTVNNSGIFQYKMNNVDMDGFVVDVKSQDAHLETQNYRLLMSANNDNTRLINNR